MVTERDTLRQKKLIERDSRISEIYARYPRLKELESELYDAGIEALRVVSRGGDPARAREAVSRIRAERARILRSVGLDESVYDAYWECEICQDRGYTAPGMPCECQSRGDIHRNKAESGLSPLQMTQTFDSFSLEWYDDPKDVKIIVEQAKGFAEDLIRGESRGNLFLYGPVGNGKTHLGSAIANMALEAGKSVAYYRAEELLGALRDEMYGRGADQVSYEPKKKITRADLLILDDLGGERLTDFAEEQLIGVIDQRLNLRKPWMLISHLKREEFIDRYDPRLVDRVLGEGKSLYLKEKSIRYKRATGR